MPYDRLKSLVYYCSYSPNIYIVTWNKLNIFELYKLTRSDKKIPLPNMKPPETTKYRNTIKCVN